MKFSVCLATGYEGLAYPIPFCEPKDLVRTAVLCEKLGFDAVAPIAELAARLDAVLGAGGELAMLAAAGPGTRERLSLGTAGLDDEIAALELTRRASASDVGAAGSPPRQRHISTRGRVHFRSQSSSYKIAARALSGRVTETNHCVLVNEPAGPVAPAGRGTPDFGRRGAGGTHPAKSATSTRSVIRERHLRMVPAASGRLRLFNPSRELSVVVDYVYPCLSVVENYKADR